MAGKFITFEGGEGAGMSTQAALLKKRLSGMGIGVALTPLAAVLGFSMM